MKAPLRLAVAATRWRVLYALAALLQCHYWQSSTVGLTTLGTGSRSAGIGRVLPGIENSVTILATVGSGNNVWAEAVLPERSCVP